MNQAELVSVVDLIAAADGRNVNEQTYGAWFLVIGHLDARLAREAALEAMRDDTLRWVEPKHVLGKVNKIRERIEVEKRRLQALEPIGQKKSDPAPICVDHGISLMRCQPCSIKAFKLSESLDGMNGAKYQAAFWGTVAVKH
jgi:hypothetical protein